MKSLKIYITFFITFFITFVQADDKLIELRKNASQAKTDTSKLKAYTALSNHYTNINKDSAFYYIEKGEEICKLLITKEYLDTVIEQRVNNICANLYELKGYFLFRLNSSDKAIEPFEKAIEHFKKGANKLGQATSFNNLAVLFKNTGNNVLAIEYSKKALKFFDELDHLEGKASILANLSNVFREQGDLETAFEYANTSLSLYRTELNNNGIAKLLNDLAGLKKEIGDTVAAILDYESALSIYRELNNKSGEAKVLNNIGAILKNQKKYDKARSYFLESLHLSESINNSTGVGFVSINIGELDYVEGKLRSAEEKAKKALSIGEQQSNPIMIKRAAELLQNIYIEQNDWKKAFDMQSLYMETQEQILNDQTKKAAIQESMRYTYDKQRTLERKEAEKHKQLAHERQIRNRIINIAIGAIALMLLFIVIFAVNRLRLSNKQKKLIQKQSDEQKLLLQEVHHRVKNNFQIVSSLLRLQSYNLKDDRFLEVFDDAINRINAMSLVHDIIYKQDAFSTIDSKEYLIKLTEQLKRSAKPKEIDIQVETGRFTLRIQTLIHIGIVLNELIMNSIKYGFKEEIKDPKIRISLSKTDNVYNLKYMENGVGINLKDYKKSFGMDLIDTIITQHDGNVKVYAEPDWKTIVSVSFEEDLS